MEMSGQSTLNASREAVWTALNDPEILRQAIPGCETLEHASDNEFAATVVLKVGPIKAKFLGRVTLSEIRPPEGYTITGQGQGGVAGFAEGGATVRLEAVDAAHTILHYNVQAKVGGKIAQLGARLIDSTAKKLTGQFFDRFGELVGNGREQPGENPAPSRTAV
jgi:carbon monoxide dehydrogenase subunit G